MHVHLHAKAEAAVGGGATPPTHMQTAARDATVAAIQGRCSTASSARSPAMRWTPRSRVVVGTTPISQSYEQEAFDAKRESGRRLAAAGCARPRSGISAPTPATSAGSRASMARRRSRSTPIRRVWTRCTATRVAENASALLPLVSDLANPSPAIGWANGERMTLDERGPADLVLALALMHHLAIGNNVPLGRIADYFARIARRAIVEFVPKSDPMVQQMMAGRGRTCSPATPAEASSGRSAPLSRSTSARSSRHPIASSI